MDATIRQERQAWRERLLTGLLWCTALAAVLAAAFIVEGHLLGWATLPFAGVALTLVVAAAAKPLGFLTRTILLLGGVYAAVCLSFLTTGFTPNGCVALAATSAMATLLLGRRWGINALVATSSTIGAVFLLTSTEVLPRADDWYHAFDASDIGVALRLLIVFVAASGIIVFGTSHLLDRAERLLDQKAAALAALQEQVAEREELEQTLQQEREASRRAGELELLARLASFAAHDFNNALLVIRGASDMIRGQVSPSEVAEALDMIDTATSQAAATSAQLRSFGRQEPGTRTELDAREQLSRLSRMLSYVLPTNISVEVAAPHTATVVADEASFQRTLVNLALNARDAMPAGGTLSFALRPADPSLAEAENQAVIEVTDTGHGIPMDLLERIFEPFYSTKGERGSGLGLSSVRELVRSQGGDVRVRSEVGAGTTFSVAWPLALDGAVTTR